MRVRLKQMDWNFHFFSDGIGKGIGRNQMGGRKEIFSYIGVH